MSETTTVLAQDAGATEEAFDVYEARRTAGETATPAADGAGDEAEEKTDPLADKTAGTKQESDESEGDEDEADGDEGEKPKKKSGAQRSRERIAALEAKLDALERGKPADKPAGEKAAPAGGDAKPKAADFDEYDDYVAAVADWTVAQRESKAQVTQAQQAVVTKWQSLLVQGAKEIDNFSAIVRDSKVIVTPAMYQSVLASEVGPQLVHHLATHADDAARIAALAPVAAAREMGLIEATLAKTPETQTKKATQAPPPVKPVGGGKAAPRIESASDFASYEAIRHAEARRK